MMPQTFNDASRVAVDEELDLRPRREALECRRVQVRWLCREAGENFLVPGPRRVGLEREHVAPALDNREFVDEALELGNQVRRDENCPTTGRAFLVRANDRLDEFAPHDRIETGRGLVKDEQFRFRANRGDERQLCPLAFREVARLLTNVEAELAQEVPFGVAIPVFAEGRTVLERRADSHPWIEGHVIRDVRETGLDGHFVTTRSMPKLWRSRSVGRISSAGAVVVVWPAPFSEEPGASREQRWGQPVHRVGRPYPSNQVLNVDRNGVL